jgi:xylulokinase
MPLVAGVDCSTQSTKVLVVDTGDGRVVASGAASHPVEGTGGASESDPRDWEESLASALAESGKASEIAALSVAGQQHGLVVLDGEGQPVRKAPLWNDTRSAPDARTIVAALGGPAATAARVGSVLTASFTVAHWAWLRRMEPRVAAAARRVLLPHDYLNLCLTGQATTDRSDVSGTGWWSPGDEAYAEDVLALEAVRLDAALLPEVLTPNILAGSVTPGAAGRFGLAPGTWVACGAGDNAGGALALDMEPGEAALSLGTSGTVYAVADRPSDDPTGTVAGFASADGRFLPLACTLNATLAIDQVAEWLGLEREDVAPSDGVVFLPWLGGERTPNAPTASGALSGLHYGTDKRSVLQAAYEGVVATLLEATASLELWAPQDPESPLLLLGGGARGQAWQETVRRLSGRPVLVVDVAEPVAYGAAVQAGALLDGLSPGEVAKSWGARRGRLLEPLQRDEPTLARIASWRHYVLASLGLTSVPGAGA